MKAVQISRFGGPEVLEIVELPTPSPEAGQLLVRVGASGVNLADALTRQDRYAVTPPLPAVLGAEAAGVVEALGAGARGFAIGQRVAAPLFANNSLGAYAEFVVIDASLAMRQAPPKGKTVLINAAAGGVGSLLVQLAKRAGARLVIAGASTQAKLDFARSLGADGGVNYTKSDWTEELRRITDGNGPDIIYESVGGEVTAASLAALAPLGQIVIYGALNIQSFQLGVPELLGLIFKNQSLTGFAFAPLLTPEGLRSGLAELFDLVTGGEVAVTIGGRYPLTQASNAHGALEGRGTTGKLILTA
jgi:NADPH:quinone reductase